MPDLVAVEVEKDAADALRERFAGTNVQVMHGDAGALPFDDDSFDSAGSFTMLHHVPSAALQNRVLAEVLRVLRPGGTLIGSDGLPAPSSRVPRRRRLNPRPATLLTRLQPSGSAR